MGAHRDKSRRLTYVNSQRKPKEETKKFLLKDLYIMHLEKTNTKGLSLEILNLGRLLGEDMSTSSGGESPPPKKIELSLAILY